MIDKLIYVDPFMLKSEREYFIKNFKEIQKNKREAKMIRTQTVYRSDSILQISSLAATCFENDRILLVVREYGVFDCVNSIKKIFKSNIIL